MRARKQQRMTLSTGDELLYRLFRGVISDDSELRGVTESAVIIDRVLDSFLPADTAARRYAVPLYAGDQSLAETLDSLFGDLSAGVDGHPAHDNGLSLVETGHQLALTSSTAINPNAERVHHLCRSLESLIALLERENAESERVLAGKTLLSGLTNPDGVTYTSEVFALVLDNWQTLRQSTYAYRVLASACATSTGWPDESDIHSSQAVDARKTLVAAIEQVVPSWNSS